MASWPFRAKQARAVRPCFKHDGWIDEQLLRCTVDGGDGIHLNLPFLTCWKTAGKCRLRHRSNERARCPCPPQDRRRDGQRLTGQLAATGIIDKLLQAVMRCQRMTLLALFGREHLPGTVFHPDQNPRPCSTSTARGFAATGAESAGNAAPRAIHSRKSAMT